MDLHVIGPLASPAERAAVDAVLGPAGVAAGSAARGTRGPTGTRRAAATRRGAGATCCSRRSTRSRSRIGWISQPALNYVCRRLAVAAGRGLRRRDVLRPVRDEAAAAGRRPRLRRHRLPARRRGGRSAPTSSGPSGRPGEPARDGRVDLAAQPVPRAVRAGAGGAVHDRRRDADATRRASRRPTRPACVGRGSSDAASRAGRTATRRVGAAGRRARPRACSAASASSTRRRSTTTARTAATAPCARALEIGPEARHRRGHRLEARRAAAARRSRPAASGPRSRPSRRSRTTSSATPTSRSRARSRTASCIEGDPFAVVEAMTIAGVRDRRASRATSTSAASTRAAEARIADAIARRARRGLLGAGHPGLGLRLRHRAPARRRRLHLRRGDGAVRVDRGQARRAAQQAAVPGRGRAVRQADRRQQRRDAGQRPAHRARDGGEAFAGDRHGGLDRARSCSACPATSRGRASTRSSSGRRCGELIELGRRRRRAAGRSGRSCSAARRACSSGPDALDTAADVRGDARDRARRSARAWSWSSTRPPTWSTRCAGSPSSSATSRAASACRAGSAPCARRSCSRGSRPARASGSRDEELALLREIGQAMRDASICGLGQTASSAIESALRQPELVAL